MGVLSPAVIGAHHSQQQPLKRRVVGLGWWRQVGVEWARHSWELRLQLHGKSQGFVGPGGGCQDRSAERGSQ